MKRLGVLFDFDGTLADTLPGAHRGVIAVCERYRVRPPTFTQFLRTFQAPYAPCYEALGVTAPVSEFMPHYHAAAGHEHASMFSDVAATLSYLARQKVVIGIVTTQRRRVVDERCEACGIADYVRFKACSLEDKTPGIEDFCRAFSLERGSVYFVGDFPSDMRDGRAAGVRCVGITRGNPVGDLLVNASADYCIEHLGELLPILRLQEQLMLNIETALS